MTFPDDPGADEREVLSVTLGRRKTPVPGPLRPPTPEERAWVRAMANRRTRVPKGVFRYRTIQEATADWEGWCAELVTATVSPSRQV
jgi:hypothetical protein